MVVQNVCKKNVTYWKRMGVKRVLREAPGRCRRREELVARRFLEAVTDCVDGEDVTRA